MNTRIHHAVFLPLYLVLTLLLFSVTAWAAPGKKAEDVAVVNGKPISAEVLAREIGVIVQRAQAQGQAPDDRGMAAIREVALDMLIKRELLSQESKKAGVMVDKARIDKELDSYKKNFAGDKEFAAALAEAGTSEAELRRQIAGNYAIRDFVEARFKGKAKVSEQEAKDFYNKNKTRFAQPEMARARHILIMSKEGEAKADRARKREKLVQIKKELTGGADFAALAGRFSECPSKAQGGDLGAFGRGQMVKPFEKAVFAMMPGDVSDIVETEFGFHLIKLEEKKPARTVEFAEAKEQISSFLAQEKMNEKVEAFLAEVRARADIKIPSQQARKE